MTEWNKAPIVLVDLDPFATQRWRDSEDVHDNDADIEYCEDVLGEFPETATEAADIIAGRRPPRPEPRKPGSDGWREHGDARAMQRWRSVSASIRTKGEWDGRDIVIAETAAAMCRRTGRRPDAHLIQFLGLEAEWPPAGPAPGGR